MTEIKYGKLIVSIDDERLGCAIIGCEKDAISVEIPFKIDQVNVVAIGERAFKDCDKLKEVTFSDEFYKPDFDRLFLEFEIGAYAFQNCVSLVEIEFPDCVRTICNGAFYNCTALTSVQVDGCFVESYAFYGCVSLKEITPLGYISEGVFSHCKSLEILPISNGVKEISEDAFYHCYALKEIVIPSSVKLIAPLAFRSCYNLKKVVFEQPDGWYVKTSRSHDIIKLDLSDVERNAKMLSQMDFDDGVLCWYKD